MFVFYRETGHEYISDRLQFACKLSVCDEPHQNRAQSMFCTRLWRYPDQFFNVPANRARPYPAQCAGDLLFDQPYYLVNLPTISN
jgi:hypothetical protein